MAAQQLQLPGWEEMPNVNRNDHTDHSHYRFARRLQWHRGRTVLWHRILWRRRPRAHHRHPADPAPARTDLRLLQQVRFVITAQAGDPVRRGAKGKIAESSGILDTPLSRSMTVAVNAPRRFRSHHCFRASSFLIAAFIDAAAPS